MNLESILPVNTMNKKHILLAGENEANSLSICLILESYNFFVSKANEEVDLLKKIEFFRIKKKPVDLIILGTELSDLRIKIFFDGIDKSLPFIIISDSQKIKLMRDILNNGFYGCLLKPTDSILLVEQASAIIFNINKYKGNRN